MESALKERKGAGFFGRGRRHKVRGRCFRSCVAVLFFIEQRFFFLRFGDFRVIDKWSLAKETIKSLF